MDAPNLPTLELAPGTRVRITKQVPREQGSYSSVFEGIVVKQELKPTGSWMAEGKNDRLWLDRLTVRRPDGELFVCNIEATTRIEKLV